MAGKAFVNGVPIEELVVDFDNQTEGLRRFKAMRQFNASRAAEVATRNGDGRFGMRNGIPRHSKHKQECDR